MKDVEEGSSSRPSSPRTPSTADLLTRSASLIDTANLFQPGRQFDVLTARWVAQRPLMEVAAPPPGRFLTATGRMRHTVKVHEKPSLESAVLLELPPHTLVRVIGICEMTDGSMKRALIVLHKTSHPLGWVTATTAEGEAMLWIFARPIYEVVVHSANVHKHYEPSSKRVAELTAGTRVHVLETRRTSDGGQRVVIRLLGKTAALGWMLSIRPDGAKSLSALAPELRTLDLQTGQLELRAASPSPRPSSPTSADKVHACVHVCMHLCMQARRRPEGFESSRGLDLT